MKKIKRLGWVQMENGEPVMIEVAEKNTVYLGSWGNAVPCRVTIEFTAQGAKRPKTSLRV